MRYLLLGLLLLLGACAPVKTAAPAKGESLLPQLLQLPGAVVATAATPGFSYPDQVMFARYAVLPMPGGPKLLNPLAQFLIQNPQLSWQVEVRAQTTYGADYDQLLAEKRSELLASYLLSKGVDLHALSFQPIAGPGEQLIFTLLTQTTAE